MERIEKYSIIGISIVMAVTIFANAAVKANITEKATETYMVQNGDTLWEIAGKYCPENMDKRDYIDNVIKLNNMEDATLYADRSIQVIIY